MKLRGPSRLQSSRARARRIDRVFECIMQVLLIVFFLFTLTSMSSRHDAFRIKGVVVEGAEATNVEHMKVVANTLLSQKLLWKIDRNNGIFYPHSELLRALYEVDARIQYVGLSVSPLTQLNILIHEYQPSLLWCDSLTPDASTSSPSCYLADKHGYVYATAPLYSGYPFAVFHTTILGRERASPVGAFVLPQDEFARVGDFRTQLSERGITVREVSQSKEQDYHFVTSEGWQIVWSTERDIRESVENLLAARAEMEKPQKTIDSTSTQRVIDLRFENKIFYR